MPAGLLGDTIVQAASGARSTRGTGLSDTAEGAVLILVELAALATALLSNIIEATLGAGAALAPAARAGADVLARGRRLPLANVTAELLLRCRAAAGAAGITLTSACASDTGILAGRCGFPLAAVTTRLDEGSGSAAGLSRDALSGTLTIDTGIIAAGRIQPQPRVTAEANAGRRYAFAATRTTLTLAPATHAGELAGESRGGEPVAAAFQCLGAGNAC